MKSELKKKIAKEIRKRFEERTERIIKETVETDLKGYFYDLLKDDFIDMIDDVIEDLVEEIKASENIDISDYAEKYKNLVYYDAVKMSEDTYGIKVGVNLEKTEE